MRIAVLGAGHVGLVTGGCLATLGHEVHVFDVDERRIQELQRSVVPFEEPHLRDLLAVAHLHGRVHFSSDAPCVIRDASLVFVCVDTPSLSEGDTDLTAVLAPARVIGEPARPSTLGTPPNPAPPPAPPPTPSPCPVILSSSRRGRRSPTSSCRTGSSSARVPRPPRDGSWMRTTPSSAVICRRSPPPCANALGRPRRRSPWS